MPSVARASLPSPRAAASTPQPPAALSRWRCLAPASPSPDTASTRPTAVSARPTASPRGLFRLPPGSLRHTPTSWGVKGGRRRHTRPLRGIVKGRRWGLRLPPSPPTVAPSPRYVRRGAPCSSPIAIRCSLRSRRVAVGSPHSGRGRGYAPATVSFSATAWLNAAHPYCVGMERGTGAGRAFCPAD